MIKKSNPQLKSRQLSKLESRRKSSSTQSDLKKINPFAAKIPGFKTVGLNNIKSYLMAKKRTVLITVLLLLTITTAAYFRYFIVPATVNGKPIFFWTYLSKLHKNFGNQVLDQIIAEEIINQEALKQGVIITPEEVNQELDVLSVQVSSSGGIDAFLASQGLSMAEFKKQIEINQKVRKLLSTQATVSAEEVNKEYASNKQYFGQLTESEAKKQIENNLKNQKIQQEIGIWFDKQREKADIKILIPGLNAK